MQRVLIAALACAWTPAEPIAQRPACVVERARWGPSSLIRAVHVPERHWVAVDACASTSARVHGGPERRCAEGDGDWLAFGPGDHGVIAVGQGEVVEWLVPGDPPGVPSALASQVSTVDICVSSATPIQTIVSSIENTAFSYSNIQIGTFARLESNTTLGTTLMATLSYYAKNATALDVSPLPRSAGAFFPPGATPPVIDGVQGIPGVFDARWTLPIGAYLITLRARPGASDGDTAAAVARLQGAVMGSILGLRTIYSEVPSGPSDIRVISSNVALIAPLVTLSFSVITTLILVLNFVRSSRSPAGSANTAEQHQIVHTASLNDQKQEKSGGSTAALHLRWA